MENQKGNLNITDAGISICRFSPESYVMTN